MNRDHDEWRRPWATEPAPEAEQEREFASDAGTGTEAGHEQDPTTGPQPVPVGAVSAPMPGWAMPDAAPGPAAVRVPPPPATAPRGHGSGGLPPSGGPTGAGGPAGGGPTAPNSATATRPTGWSGTAMTVAVAIAALVGAVVGTASTLVVTDSGGGASGQVVTVPGPSGSNQAPVVQIEGDGGNVVPAVAAAVTPSVVRIDIYQTPTASTPSGLGSGVVYRSDGYIITNNHVVQDAARLRVKLSSGLEYDAELVGTDPRNDLAVVKIDATDLPAINLRDTEPVVGETAIAIGSPFGLDASVTAGVVSAVGRNLEAPDGRGDVLLIPAVLQTDAAINPGNSGGALVDENGRLLGINTAILTGSGGSQGVGFAISVAQAVVSADQLIETGQVQYPLMGVRGGNVTADIAERFDLPNLNGAYIESVDAGTGAADAGIQAEDIVIAVNGQEIRSMSDLIVTVRRHRPGETIEVTYLRDGAERTVPVTLGELTD